MSIWILGSKLILSNKHSRATLCVRETCLIVGLRPLIIILITDLLSSKTYNMAPAPEVLCVGCNVVNVCGNDVGVLELEWPATGWVV